MSSASFGIPQVQPLEQPQEQPSNCSQYFSTAGSGQTPSRVFASWNGVVQTLQRQGLSPVKVQTKGRFTIIEEEGSSPKLSFKLPSFGGSLSGQKMTAGASTAYSTPADVKAATTSGTTKSANTDCSCSQPSNSSKRPAAGALQMPGATR